MLFLSLKQAVRLKTLDKENNCDENIICMVVTQNRKSSNKSSSLKKYFLEDYITKQVKEIIYKFLKALSEEINNSKKM